MFINLNDFFTLCLDLLKTQKIFLCTLGERFMGTKYSVLVIEDDATIRSFMTAVLSSNGYKVISANSGQQGLVMISSYRPDVVLLDLGLPDIDGINVLKSVREWTLTPIIVVSARESEEDKVQALDFGADDYMVKPFGTAELLARIRGAIRHWNSHQDRGITESGTYKSGELAVDLERRRVTFAGKDVHLTQNEYRIVALLCKNSGRVLTYEYIIKDVWGPYTKGDNQILRVNMANIRRKIEPNPAAPKYIITEVGVGYRMAEAE